MILRRIMARNLELIEVAVVLSSGGKDCAQYLGNRFGHDCEECENTSL